MARRLLVPLLALVAAIPATGQYFGKNKIRYDRFDWQVYPTPHFRISYYDRVAPALEKVASYAESSYDELARRLNFQIPDPIPMIIYASHAEFEQNNVIVEFIPEGVGAFATPVRNRMVLPVDLPDVDLQQLIQHELTHIFQYEILFQGKLGKAVATRPPQWFMEGMASYFANDEDSRARAVMRDAVFADRVPSVGDAVGGYLAYRFGNRVFAFVEAQWGEEGLRDFVYEFRNTLGSKVEKALKRAFDLDVDEFDGQFRAWLRKQYQEETLDRGEPREFGPAFRAEEGKDSTESSPVASPSGDLIAAFSTYKKDLDVVLFGVPDRRLFRNLTRGRTTAYDYLVAQGLTVGPDRGRDLAFSPGGDTVAVFARHERGRVLLLLNAVRGGIAETYPIPVDQAMEPAFSPDGKTVAFRAFSGGQADIYLLDLASGSVTNFTNDPAYDAAPTFSPDGTHLVYSSQTGADAKLFEAALADPGSRRQLTFGPGNDEGAAFSSDGKTLYFASDRDRGIFDIYALNLESRALTRLTSVIGAALNPTPVLTRDGERVVYQAFTRGSFQLYVTDPAQGHPAGTEEPPREVAERPPFVPAVSVTVDPNRVEKAKKRKLFIEDAQVLLGVNEDQTLISQTYLSFSDHYGDRQLGVLLQSVSGYSTFQLSYYDLSKRLQWGATVFDDRAYFVGYSTVTGRAVRLEQVYRQTGAAAYLQYPLSRYYRVEGVAGYFNRDAYYPYATDYGGRPVLYWVPASNSVPFVEAAFTGDTTLWQSYGPHSGHRFRFSAAYLYDLDNGGKLSQDVRLDARAYLPLSHRNEVAVRLWGGYANGSQPSIFWFGGLDTLRGFEYHSLAGNRAAYLNLEWRFPLIDHLVLPWLYVNNIRGRFFLDVGAAYFDLPWYHQDFDFMTDGRLVQGVSAYGFGVSMNLFGLPAHWDFAKRWDLKSTLSDRRTTFWIGYRY